MMEEESESRYQYAIDPEYEDRIEADTSEDGSLYSERDRAASFESDRDPEAEAETELVTEPSSKRNLNSTCQFGFNLEDVKESLNGAYSYGKTMFNTQVVISALFPVQEDQSAVEASIVEPTVNTETVAAETEVETEAETEAAEDDASDDKVAEDVQEFASVSKMSMKEEEQAVVKKQRKEVRWQKEEFKEEKPKKRRGILRRPMSRKYDRNKSTAPKKNDLSVSGSRSSRSKESRSSSHSKERRSSSRSKERRSSSRSKERKSGSHSKGRKEKKVRGDDKRGLENMQRTMTSETKEDAEKEEIVATVEDQADANDRETGKEEDSNRNNIDEEDSKNGDKEEESTNIVKEEENKNNPREEENKETDERIKTVTWNDFELVGKARTAVVSALARTLDQQNRADSHGVSTPNKCLSETKPVLENDGTSSIDKNPSKMEPNVEQQESNSLLASSLAERASILQEESNSLLATSLKEGENMQVNSVPELDINAVGNATTEDVPENGKNTSFEGSEVIVGKADGDNTVVSFLTQATGQTKWTSYFSPTMILDVKKESETTYDEDDDNFNTPIFASIFGGGGDGDATVVSGLTLASGQSKWARSFKPAETQGMEPIHDKDEEISFASQRDGSHSTVPKQPLAEKTWIEPNAKGAVQQQEEAVAVAVAVVDHDDDVKPTFPSLFGDNEDDADANTVVSGLTLESSQSKWTRYFKPAELNPIRENEKSSPAKACNNTTIIDLAEVMKSSAEDSESESSSSSSSSSSSGSTAVRTAYSSKIRAEDTDFFELETKEPTNSRYVKSSSGTSKSFKAKLPSSDASIVSTPNVPSSPFSVKPSPSKVSKAKLPSSDATTASTPNVSSSSRSVKSFGGPSKSSKARLLSSGASIVSTPNVPSSSRSVKSLGGPSKSSKAKLSSSGASIASTPNVPSSSRSVKSLGGPSKSSKAKLSYSGASIASTPNVPSSSRSVKSLGGPSKSSKARLLSSGASIASTPNVPSSSRSVKSSSSKTSKKSSKAKLPFSCASIASTPKVPLSTPSQSPASASKSSTPSMPLSTSDEPKVLNRSESWVNTFGNGSIHPDDEKSVDSSSSSSTASSSGSMSNASSSSNSVSGSESKRLQSVAPLSDGSDSSDSDSSDSDSSDSDSEDETLVSEVSSKPRSRWFTRLR